MRFNDFLNKKPLKINRKKPNGINQLKVNSRS